MGHMSNFSLIQCFTYTEGVTLCVMGDLWPLKIVEGRFRDSREV